jgi:hypothetical protein
MTRAPRAAPEGYAKDTGQRPPDRLLMGRVAGLRQIFRGSSNDHHERHRVQGCSAPRFEEGAKDRRLLLMGGIDEDHADNVIGIGRRIEPDE